jgi:hypothetical protein
MLNRVIPNDVAETTTNVDSFLETEKQKNKVDSWNKLDKTMKIQKLHAYAEKYAVEQGKDVVQLKRFFIDALEKGKFQKTKDVVYDKENQSITSIPALLYNTATNNYTLRIMDPKRVSTLKSLTPKRISEKNKDSKVISIFI